MGFGELELLFYYKIDWGLWKEMLSENLKFYLSEKNTYSKWYKGWIVDEL